MARRVSETVALDEYSQIYLDAIEWELAELLDENGRLKAWQFNRIR